MELKPCPICVAKAFISHSKVGGTRQEVIAWMPFPKPYKGART